MAPRMTRPAWPMALAATLCCSSLAMAEPPACTTSCAAPHNIARLSATSRIDVRQDFLTITLSTTTQAGDPATVQAKLRKEVAAAMAEVKKTAQPGELDVRSNTFSIGPNYGSSGKINAWQGSAGIVLEGKDFERIMEAASRVRAMTIANLAFGLSPAEQERAETDARAIALQRFKARADEIARAFGFAGYTLGEVNVGYAFQDSNNPLPVMEAEVSRQYVPRVVAEPGKTPIALTVSGTIELK